MKTLKELVTWDTLTLMGRGWAPARPEHCCWRCRLRDAWLVLIGKADAFTWPGGQ